MSTFKYLRSRTNYGIYSTISVAFLNTRYAVTSFYQKIYTVAIPKIGLWFVCVTSLEGGGKGAYIWRGLFSEFYGFSSDCHTSRGLLVLSVLKKRYKHTVNALLIYLKAVFIGAFKVCNKFLCTQ